MFFQHRQTIDVVAKFGMVEIYQVNEATVENLEPLNRLLPQLSSSAKPMTIKSLNVLLNENAVHLYFAKVDEEVMGMLTLVMFPIPSGWRGWVEDVVVDTRARGKGVGKALTQYALSEAEKRGVLTVDLTSRPSREVANKLYQSIGFERRDTNVYRYKNVLP